MSRMTYMRSWKSLRLTSHTWLGLNPQIGRTLLRIVGCHWFKTSYDSLWLQWVFELCCKEIQQLSPVFWVLCIPEGCSWFIYEDGFFHYWSILSFFGCEPFGLLEKGFWIINQTAKFQLCLFLLFFFFKSQQFLFYSIIYTIHYCFLNLFFSKHN
jgi:hypothetical protein